MARDKSPRPDGFHMVFFKAWDIVGGEVTRVCLEVLDGSASVKAFSQTFVTLISMINNPRRLADFRPFKPL